MQNKFSFLPIAVMLAKFSLRLPVYQMIMKLFLHTGTMEKCFIFQLSPESWDKAKQFILSGKRQSFKKQNRVCLLLFSAGVK